MQELLLIDKPKGITSFDVIRQLRRKTGIKKFGHAGTLDPLASGLMLIGVEKGTKLLASLVGLDKEYEAEILLGERRSTGDMEGEVLEEKEYADNITTEQVYECLQSLIGDIELPVSAYSAIKKDGVPMYKKARAAEKRGELVPDIPLRAMRVLNAALHDSQTLLMDNKKRLQLKVTFMVGSGTYIRSLAEEIGRRLNYPAVMSNLRRTKIGEYKIEDAMQLSNFSATSLETK
ncbi:MAG TPA: tRNA pseudouridine(55) synthase TruB [Candidatus Paceibacterota bacterium]|nr:tRNA pseudouridine(55) synthase TruB [Candidatus Paceibacterota bacterium]